MSSQQGRPTGRPNAHVVTPDSQRGTMISSSSYAGMVIQLSLKMCPFTVRLVPVRDYDDPTRWAGFRGSDGREWGDWLWYGNLADRIGVIPTLKTYLLNPFDSPSEVAENPLSILYRKCQAIARQKKLTPTQNCDPYNATALIDRGDKENGKGKIPSLKDIVGGYIVTGGVVQKENKAVTLGLDGKPPLIHLPTTAAKAMLSAFQAEYAKDSKFDPISFNKGVFVQFFEKGKDPAINETSSDAPVGDIGSVAPDVGGESKGNGDFTKSFECKILPSAIIKGKRVGPNFTSIEPKFAQHLGTWNDMLHYPTNMEIVDILASIFPKGLVIEAMSDHPTWLSPSLRDWKPPVERPAAPLSLPSAPAPVVPTSGPGAPPLQGYMPTMPAAPSVLTPPPAPTVMPSLPAPTVMPSAPPVYQAPPAMPLAAVPVPVPEFEDVGDLGDIPTEDTEAPFDAPPQGAPRMPGSPQIPSMPGMPAAPTGMPMIPQATMGGTAAIKNRLAALKGDINAAVNGGQTPG